MFAILVVALFVCTAALVGLSLTDSAMRARRAWRRMQRERGQFLDNGIAVEWRSAIPKPAAVKLTLVSSAKCPSEAQPPLAVAA